MNQSQNYFSANSIYYSQANAERENKNKKEIAKAKNVSNNIKEINLSLSSLNNGDLSN